MSRTEDIATINNKEAAAPKPSLIPLADEWSFHWERASVRKNRKASQNKGKEVLGSFSSVQGFWVYFNNIDANIHKLVSVRKKYAFELDMFKSFIQPAVSDPANVNGGKWVIQCPADLEATLLIWKSLLVGAVGQSLLTPSDLRGCKLICKSDRNEIEVWTRKHPDLYSDEGLNTLMDIRDLVLRHSKSAAVIYCPHTQIRVAGCDGCEVCTECLSTRGDPTESFSSEESSESSTAEEVSGDDDPVSKPVIIEEIFGEVDSVNAPVKQKKSKRNKKNKHAGHVQSKDCEKHARKEKSRSPCRYGSRCNRPDCYFTHPTPTRKFQSYDARRQNCSWTTKNSSRISVAAGGR